jgi:hypothetical protein
MPSANIRNIILPELQGIPPVLPDEVYHIIVVLPGNVRGD